MKKLILWDIDGTLISAGGVAGEAMQAAMQRVYGDNTAGEGRSYAGKTDQQIILETFAARAQDDLLSVLEQFTDIYVEEMGARQATFLARCRVLDGVVRILDQLAGQDVIQTLLTGNIKPIARLKLDWMGLGSYFDFEAGAYGSDHHIRANLVPIAVARAAQRYNQTFAGNTVVVIGDTPYDIDCGRAAGARTVAVATGPFSIEELRAHGPDAALPNLASEEAALAAILGERD